MMSSSMGALRLLFITLSFLLPTAAFSRNPLADIRRTVYQRDVSPLALREKSNAFLSNQSHILQVKDHVSTPHLRRESRVRNSAMLSSSIRPASLCGLGGRGTMHGMCHLRGDLS